ncbi:MAG: N-6 DNA methylase [Chloroflexi bacterium]|nr:N-6 DNA methylase [Chloroflexota bacterium]
MSHQKLPTEWSEREKLREKGQFWTPDWVAQAMVLYVIEDSNMVFDPAVGRGAFYSALRRINQQNQTSVKFYGSDIDAEILQEGEDEGLFEPDTCDIELRDFILDPPKRHFRSIVANPPYIRHHRLSTELKEVLKQISLKALGHTIDARAGLHVYFLIQALLLLERNGKLAFIMPADTCEGVFANKLWQWITRNYCLECVIAFTPKATPFPNVDTNAVVFLIKNTEPKERIIWVKVCEPENRDLSLFVQSKFGLRWADSLRILGRSLNEALRTGLSRDPSDGTMSEYTLFDFATVMRGIATGGNDFFFLTREESHKRAIPPEFLRLAIGRTRDVEGSYVDNETINRLDSRGRPTLLFAPDGWRIEEFPIEVQKYLREGESRGLPTKPLISSRKPWYKMEHREAPPIIFAYLGRRNARFVRNLAGVVPLTGFLCVYPRSKSQEYIERLWQVLQHQETTDNLKLVAKTYGSGAIKVEPRSLERLRLPAHLLNEYSLPVQGIMRGLEPKLWP